MQSLRDAYNKASLAAPVSTLGLAKRLGMLPPVALRAIVKKLEALPTELHFDQDSIAFDVGVSVGGFCHLTLRRDGTYSFSGHFHDSGVTEYNVSLVLAVKDSANIVYTFQQAGHVAGTLEAGSRDYDWSTDAQNDAVTQHWTDLAIGANATIQASATLDMTNLTNSVIGAIGLVLGVIGIVVSGSSSGSGGGGTS
jgi:hypothetical protein